MLSKSKISLINSLDQKKYRLELGLFVVEGEKMLLELADSNFKPREVFLTASFIEKHPTVYSNFTLVEPELLQKITFLKTVSAGLALVEIPNYSNPILHSHNKHLLCLDGIRDPGNLGTIIRTAEWFGHTDIVCSIDTTDCFNPKTIQASMGSIFRVKLHYLNLPEYLISLDKSLEIYGADMHGESIYEIQKSKGMLVIGNEVDGLRPAIRSLITKFIAIPKKGSKAESLNAAMAAGIICAEFARPINQ